MLDTKWVKFKGFEEKRPHVGLIIQDYGDRVDIRQLYPVDRTLSKVRKKSIIYVEPTDEEISRWYVTLLLSE